MHLKVAFAYAILCDGVTLCLYLCIVTYISGMRCRGDVRTNDDIKLVRRSVGYFDAMSCKSFPSCSLLLVLNSYVQVLRIDKQ